jgi:hypothetical protein
MIMYPPTNFRTVNDPNLKLNTPDNPANNCTNCLFFKQVDDMLNGGKIGDCSYYNYPDELINEDHYCIVLHLENPRNSEPSKSVCDYHFLLRNIGNIKQNDSIIKEHCAKIDKLLDQKYAIPLSKVYRAYSITNEDLCNILSELAEGYAELFDITDSEILIDNHYRIRFLDHFCDSCKAKLEEKGSEQLRSKLKKFLLAQPASRICGKCGEQVFQGEKFCSECGKNL